MRKSSLLVLFCFCIAIAQSQKKYLPGFVVKNKDTIPGSIDYKNWERNPKSISFKAGGTASAETFTTNDIEGFGITGRDIYQKAIVLKDMRPVTVDNNDLIEPAPGNLVNVRDTVFLRVLVLGNKISLFELVDDKPHFYVRKTGEDPQELQYSLIPEKDGTHFTGMFTFRDQLKALMPMEAAGVSRKIESAGYTAKDLEKIVRSLNSSIQEPSQQTQKRSRLLAGVGISYNSVDFPVEYRGINTLETNTHIGYEVGGGIDLLSLRNFQRFFVRLYLAYSSYNYKGSGERDENFNVQRIRYSYDLKINSLTPSLMMGYNFLKNAAFNPYVGLRLGMNFSSYPTNLYKKENLTAGDKETIDEFLALEKSWLELDPKIGVMNKKFDFSISSRLIGSFANFATWKPKHQFFSFTAAYFIK
jgi:hypothetical protein